MFEQVFTFDIGTKIFVPYQVVVSGCNGLQILNPGTYYICNVRGNFIEIKDVNSTYPIFILATELEKLEMEAPENQFS
jgi:hypothetical protein